MLGWTSFVIEKFGWKRCEENTCMLLKAGNNLGYSNIKLILPLLVNYIKL